MSFKSIIRRRELKPNTFINGVGATYTTAALLADEFIGIEAADIKVFKNDGVNISCLISMPYTVTNGAFYDSNLTAFIDFGGFARASRLSSFRVNNNCLFFLPSMREIGIFTFSSNLNQRVLLRSLDTFESNSFSVSTGTLYLPSDEVNNVTFSGTKVDITSLVQPDRVIAATASNVGATFMTIAITNPASTNTIEFVLMFKNGFFDRILPLAATYELLNIPENTTDKYQFIVADEFFNLSFLSRDLFTVTRPAVSATALAVDAVANYPFDETTGDAIDTINGEDGTLSGSISRDGEYYTYGGANAVVTVPNNANLNFIDGNGANVDFTIKTEFIATAFNVDNRFWIVSKTEANTATDRGWQLLYSGGQFIFGIFSEDNVLLSIRFPNPLILNKEYMFGVSCIGSNLFLNLDGEQVATEAVPNGFIFRDTTSKMEFGNALFLSNLNLIGKQKRTVILKGRGYTQQDWSDIYNGGNGIDI